MTLEKLLSDWRISPLLENGSLEYPQEAAPRRLYNVMRWSLVASIAAVFVLLLWSQVPEMHYLGQRRGTSAASPVSLRPNRDGDLCAAYLGLSRLRGGISVILTADPGDFSGTPEAQHILANLKDQVVKPRDETVCGGVYFGSLLTQDVLVITTGIGPTAAGLCVQELLTSCGPSITEMIYFGTSGWSPQLGGVLNPPDCSQANPNRKTTRVGDVCISPVSVNWVCKKSTWTLQSEGFPNQCFRPQETAGPNASALYGDCLFANDNLDGNLALSDALIVAARSARGRAALPMRSELVSELEERYWGLMSKGTGLTYPPIAREDKPLVWDYTQCAEVDGQFFFTGAPWEIKARDYASQAIATALGFGKPGSGARNAISPQEVIAVSAMEGVGVAEALEKYHRLKTTTRRIPYTNVRTLSNWIHQPVGKKGEGQWEIFQEVPEDYVNGYAYAIATGSVTVLSLYQQRCLSIEALGRLEQDPVQRVALAASPGSQPGQHGLELGGLALWVRDGPTKAMVSTERPEATAPTVKKSGWASPPPARVTAGAASGGAGGKAGSGVQSRCSFHVKYP